MNPMLDEALAVRRRTGSHAQPGLERSERTNSAQPYLRNDDDDSPRVREPEPPAVDPAPMQGVADQNEHETADDEGDDGEVQTEHRISEKVVRQYRCHRTATNPRVGAQLRRVRPPGAPILRERRCLRPTDSRRAQ